MTAGLFLCLFAAQSAVIAMAPSLSAAAADLDVSISAAGQLRTITGLVAGMTALVLGLVARRLSLRRQLLGGPVLLAAGAAGSAAAGSYAVLALAQVPLTVGCFGVARTSVAMSTVLFAAAAFVAGARTLVASAYGLSVAPVFRASLTSLRAATMQFGYFLGSIAGGLALAAGGYDAVGLTMSCFFLLASATVSGRVYTTQAQPSQ
jgi:predicted MFS family arabinose efflux permease